MYVEHVSFDGLRAVGAEATYLTSEHKVVRFVRVFLQLHLTAARHEAVALHAPVDYAERLAMVVRHLDVFVRLAHVVVVEQVVHYGPFEDEQSLTLAAAENALVALSQLSAARVLLLLTQFR